MSTGFQNFLNCEDIYTPKDIVNVIERVRPFFRLSDTNKKIKYFDIPSAFDIETTSFFRPTGNGENEKTAITYLWAFGVYGVVIMGRTWSEFVGTLNTVADVLKLNPQKRLCVYVHNFAYEFQFLRKWFNWAKVFSLDSRKPVYALTTTGIEFRCSYILSGYSLEKIGEGLRNYNVRKLVGTLDYNKLRHSETPLTAEEIAYSANDVRVLMAYIAERIEQDGEISRIPLTKTGYVRTYCRNSCFFDSGTKRQNTYKRAQYTDIMHGLRLSTDEYKQLKRAFQGGFTHANPFFSGKIVCDVTSYDFTSSYPCVMLSEKFPMSSGEKVKITSKEQFERNVKLYCCLFDVEFMGLQSEIWYENYISISRCWGVKTAVVNNGRVVSAEHLYTTLTEQDYLIVRKLYSWDEIKIGNFRRYRKDYLPTRFVKAILKLYQDKTTLKGVEGKEAEYQKSKEMLNSCYGMTVTDIVRPEYIYTEDWEDPKIPDIDQAIKKYNNNRGRFLFYPWGVWVTAYARRNLFSGILEFGDDYIYSDTDSIKARNAEQHEEYITEYNNKIKSQLEKAMMHHGINPDVIAPKTKDGEMKILGVWDFDGHYSRFKTLGAKRYIVEYSFDARNKTRDQGQVSITVSGLNKKICVPWMLSQWGKDGVFEHFSNALYVPAEYTGKMTHTYIDDVREGVIIDYTGMPGKYLERSSVHLENADYSLSISREYSDYLSGLRTENY